MKLYDHIAKQLPQFMALQQAINGGETPVLTVGLSHIHKAHFIKATADVQQRPVLLLVENESVARRLYEDISAMYGVAMQHGLVMLYPGKELTLRQTESVSREFEQLRIGVLAKLLAGECDLCVCSVEALLQYTIPPHELQTRSIQLSERQSENLSALLTRLVGAGYTRRSQVEGVAQFSLRGGILDIFSPGFSAPTRVEFFGDEIDSIHLFDLETQRRGKRLEQLTIIPTTEVLFDNKETLVEALLKLKANHKSKPPTFLTQDLDRLQHEETLPCIDKYYALAYEKPACLLDYFSEAIVFVSEYHAVKEAEKASLFLQQQDIATLLEQDQLCNELGAFSVSFGVAQQRLLSAPFAVLDTFARTSGELQYKNLITINPIMTANFSGEVGVLCEDVSPLIKAGYAVAILAGTQKAAINLAQDLQKAGLPAQYSKDGGKLSLARIVVVEGSISAGFEYPEIKVAVFSTARGSGTSQSRKQIFQKGKQLRAIDDLHTGDFVVHMSHGVGIFEGIQKIQLQGITKDYIKIKYAGSDMLYLPVTQLDLVSKYIGPKEDGRLKLNRLHSGEWKKTKARVQKACADMAEELIALYAKRMQVKGTAFAADDSWQREFENHFDYIETDDQLRAAEEIKADMQKEYPMDRLLCGDVGFGKTEIAFRAAFKCVLSGKQCVLLCPTTILAWQHYQNALKRFEQFPARVALLSRFCTAKQITQSLAQLKSGEVDIVIGTHRLLQKDVKFHDLGLAIIDEEQRFGVAHKERFKEVFAGVDMLSISATPIPRTLSMAIGGIRDISTIEQPPQDRHPVQTYVVEHDDHILATALKKELSRGGQVYYIHNRVETIANCASHLKQLVPDAVIGVAHGQMNETELSDIWRKLMEHQIDILVCTTIIETGVDVRNCNTLIIENADHFGLSQLYQLRGRVGRSNRRAFAYLTFRRGKVLTEIATKRLNAIREFTTFGSGFRIAMRDLEIRGAGSILSAKQHGHMEAIGYELYMRLLREAIGKKRGEQTDKKAYECLIDVQLEAHLPEHYIENLTVRLETYKKIASIRTECERMDLIDEMIDRFGEIPDSVVTLMEVSLLRNTLAAHGFCEVGQTGSLLKLLMEHFSLQTAEKLIEALGNRVSIRAAKQPAIVIQMPSPHGALVTLRQVAEALLKD